MRVLVPCDPIPAPFLREFCAAIEMQSAVESVTQGTPAFWSGTDESCDVVHLHWPEALHNWKEPTASDVDRTVVALQKWRERGTAIVATVHNRYPHYRNTTNFRSLYEAVYGGVDAFMHMGQASVEHLHRDFDGLIDWDNVTERVIPHGLFESFPNEIGREEARKRLGIGNQDTVILHLGGLRDWEETKLLLRGFYAARSKLAPATLLLVGRIHFGTQRQLRALRRLIVRLLPRVKLKEGFFPDQDVQIYLNASDVLVLPRLDILNSGNVSLGFCFERVVVGPNVGVVGEVLQETNNPVFDPTNLATVEAAIVSGAELARRGHGKENRRYAEAHWQWRSVGRDVVDLYYSLLEKNS